MVRATILAVLTLGVAAFAAAPAAGAVALAASKNKPSSNLPWLIGLIVVIVLAIGLLYLRIRRPK